MEDWIHINTNDVISIFEKAKTGGSILKFV